MEVLGYIFLVIIIIVVINVMRNSSKYSNDAIPLSQPIQVKSVTIRKTNVEVQYDELINLLRSIDHSYKISRRFDSTVVITSKIGNAKSEFVIETDEEILFVAWRYGLPEDAVDFTWKFKINDNQVDIFNTVLQHMKKVAAADSNARTNSNIVRLSNDIVITLPDIYPTYSSYEFEQLMKQIATSYLTQANRIIKQNTDIRKINTFTYELEGKIFGSVSSAGNQCSVKLTILLTGFVNDLMDEIQKFVNTQMYHHL